ncbi:MAG: MinD/ParA family protein [Clostridiales bacterium]|nr:MinD/ParA family protein [Clostridiales bacterium]
MSDQAKALRDIINKVNNDNISTPIGRIKTTAKVLTITSGKGGVGKTNVTVNLAIALSDMGYRVVVIDADLGLANIDVMLGIMPKYTLLDVIKNDKSIVEILSKGPKNVKFISGGSGAEELVRLNSNELEIFIRNIAMLDKIADIILIDTGAGITDSVLRFVMAANDVVLVTTPEPTAMSDAYALIKAIGTRDNQKKINLIINKSESAIEAQTVMQKLNSVASKFLKVKLNFLGYLSNDAIVSKAVKQQVPFLISFPNSIISRNMIELSKKVVKNFEEKRQETTGIKDFFNKFLFFAQDKNK